MGLMYKNHEYSLVVLHVMDEDEYGRPNTVRVVHEDTVVNLSEESSDNNFITGFIRADNTKLPERH